MEGSYQGVAQGCLIKINSIEPFALIWLFFVHLFLIAYEVGPAVFSFLTSLLELLHSLHWSPSFPVTFSFACSFAMRLLDARTYHSPLHSRLPSAYVTLVHTISRYILVNNRRIRDVRTYHFPPVWGSLRLAPIIVSYVSMHRFSTSQAAFDQSD